jgi:hypothetical protein
MERFLKGNTLMVKKMDGEGLYSQVVVTMKETLLMVNSKAKENKSKKMAP